MKKLSRSLLAALSSLTLLTASVGPAFAFCMQEEAGCPCSSETPDHSLSTPCCCVVESPAGAPVTEAESAPLRAALQLDVVMPLEDAPVLALALPEVLPSEDWTPPVRALSPLRLSLCSFQI